MMMLGFCKRQHNTNALTAASNLLTIDALADPIVRHPNSRISFLISPSRRRIAA
jgi:hypothetical protein